MFSCVGKWKTQQIEIETLKERQKAKERKYLVENRKKKVTLIDIATQRNRLTERDQALRQKQKEKSNIERHCNSEKQINWKRPSIKTKKERKK